MMGVCCWCHKHTLSFTQIDTLPDAFLAVKLLPCVVCFRLDCKLGGKRFVCVSHCIGNIEFVSSIDLNVYAIKAFPKGSLLANTHHMWFSMSSSNNFHPRIWVKYLLGESFSALQALAVAIFVLVEQEAHQLAFCHSTVSIVIIQLNVTLFNRSFHRSCSTFSTHTHFRLFGMLHQSTDSQ